MRTIGDQLISGPEAALIELVKNAYDADSPNVRITITPPSPGEHWHDHGKVIVEDRGHGMTADDLVTKWFEPATTDKLDRPSSPKGRTMLGAKGVGRFAAARLGDKLLLETTSRQR
ncbi:ATP-binding protein, partial [Zoogloea sp.]|uniref:ATP-binding protein n=1 Tax=Zoogloea sp. TaxID=49181 RepID=UPI00321FEF74